MTKEANQGKRSPLVDASVDGMKRKMRMVANRRMPLSNQVVYFSKYNPPLSVQVYFVEFLSKNIHENYSIIKYNNTTNAIIIQ